MTGDEGADGHDYDSGCEREGFGIMEKRVWPVRMTAVVEKPSLDLCMSEAIRMRI